ncbi:Uncharacterised protein [Listeria ivanovii subsp. londoniensis]|uniref:Uncharacterized protein n=2 Tax=Listeria ivanovii TaxID=1638 RepID=A0ABS1G2H2_LISIV|nr:hypothetical protein [Listeria ivanovii]EFR95621.1 membrane protein, putative [Listeria ivanovii FSL F6-596]AIS61073.1 membrane protein [Listeria ivanovii subsp. londoniensis]MBK1961077.1 hypothetical protein [Listeria ivanovii subsp. londoniensis]SDW00171.1 hypothetical protein SAMN05421782_10183 [Listeria ivanovii]VEH48447.1 Uncharacterised protein [Listeria ivanovii subsp. londoniensis]
MKTIMSKISFEEAKQLVDTKESITSRGIQLFMLGLFCGFMAVLPLKNSIIITSILILMILISFIYYFTVKSSDKLLEDFGWQMAKYLMIQTITVSILLGIRVDGDKPFGEYYILVALCYLFVVALLCYFRCKAMMLNYLKNNGINFKKTAVPKVWNKIFLKLSIGLLVAIVLGTQIYRLNKWWFIGNDSSPGVVSIQNEWLGTLIVLVGGILLIAFLVVFSLLPTLLFNAKIITDGRLLKQYAAEFHKENGFTEKKHSE